MEWCDVCGIDFDQPNPYRFPTHTTSPQSELPAHPAELEFYENRGGESSSSHENEVSAKSAETNIEFPSPFEELAHGYKNAIEEDRDEEVTQTSRHQKNYERVSRVTRSGNSTVPPPNPDVTIAFASFLAAASSTRDP